MEIFGEDEQSDSGGEMAPNLLGSFIQELEETVADLEQKIIDLEADPGNQNLINSVFRSFHNLKGSSTMVGLKILPELMHYAESVFDLVRSTRLAINEKMISLLLEVFNAMRDMREILKKDGKEGKNRYFAILTQLEQIVIEAESGAAQTKAAEGPQKAHADEGEAKKNDDDEFIKISRGLVEQLMLVVGDFMLVESSFQFMKVKYNADWKFMENCQQLSHFSNKLQNTVLRMRLSPIKPVFSSMHRVVRATAAEVSKKVAFEVHGADTLVDRTILDVIGDPIMHMLRNAVDHGLEKSEGRIQAGKALEGQITLSAFHKAGEVVIQVSDDGRGIDPVRIKAKAVEKGFVSEAESLTLSDADVNQLIFLPGFSGADVVTNVSGRGVGMDVVKRVIEGLGGNIDLLSNPGSGTTITMRLPLSMAISECLEFEVGTRNYAVPQLCIEEVFSSESPLVRGNIQTINDGSQVLVLRETPIPILDLAQIFGIEASHEHMHVIQVKHGTMRFALQVGQIVGPCNMVCQALPPIFAADAPFSGLTRRGDGSLMFQIDVGRLSLKLSSQMEVKSSTGAKIRGGTSITDSDLRRLQQKIAVFENYESFCIPVHGIKQIVSIQSQDIHEVDRQTFITLDETTIPLVWIEEVLLKKPRIKRDHYSIMIYQIEERTFGLPMDKFGGIIRMPVHYDNTLRTDIVTGSTVIESKTCLVIDLYGLTAQAFGSEVKMHEKVVVKIKRLALAEDDPFFREQLMTFLRARDLECVAFPDGMALKDYLSDPEQTKTIDAVITDVEMPRMDGLTLTRWIKGTDHTRHLPCIIITSLTNKEVIRLAMSAGATAFVPKMHHQQVMQELKRVESGLDKVDNATRLLEIQQKDNNRRIVTFNLGDSCFALPMEVLKEVSHVSPSLPVPNFPDWVNSITAFRGKMVPVINLCKLFDFSSDENHGVRQQAIVDFQGSVFAFLFDSIGEVLLVSQLVPGEGLSKASQREAHIAQYVSGIYQKDHKLISLIDPATLVKICQQKVQIITREESAA